MPKVGDIKQVYVKESRKYIWVECSDCGRGRWIQEKNQRRLSTTGLCLACYNKLSRYKRSGGVSSDGHGYVMIKLDKGDFFYSMANSKGYVREHRLVMARHLGRNLHRWEIVHHKDGIKDNNSIQNLALATKDGHDATTALQERINFLEAKLTSLRGRVC